MVRDFHSNIRVTIQSHPGNVFGQIFATTDKVFVVDWLCKGCKHYCATEFPLSLFVHSLFMSLVKLPGIRSYM